jgi:site-specific DNA-methyltransferase (adenine-specific)
VIVIKLWYKDEYVKLIQGDCLEVMDKMIVEGVKVDAVITDPPYGTTRCKWDSIIPLSDMWEKLKLIRKNNAPIIMFGSEPFSSALRMSNIKEYKYDWKWDKVTGTGHLCAKYQPMQKIEDIMIFGDGKITYNPQMIELSESEYKTKLAKISKKDSYKSKSELTNDKKELSIADRNIKNYKFAYPNNVIVCSKYIAECNNTNRLHPTQKPLYIIEYLINTYTNEGDTILDFTCGSGTTLIAAKNLKRKCIGIEKEEKYCEISKTRLQNPNKIIIKK